MHEENNGTFVHTIVELLPQSYTHTMNCHHHVLRHENIVYRTMLTDKELDEFQTLFSTKYDEDVTVQQHPKEDHISVKVFYSSDRFKTSDNTLTELDEELYFHLQRGCIQSHLSDDHLNATSR